MATLYERIDELCRQKGITGGKMCNDLGISRSTMTELRKGRTKTLKLEKASKIAKYFDVSIDYLLGNEQKEKPAQNVQVRDEHDNIVVLDDETRDLIDSLRKNPEMKMLFSVSKGATKEDIIKTIKIIEALKDRGEEGDD